MESTQSEDFTRQESFLRKPRYAVQPESSLNEPRATSSMFDKFSDSCKSKKAVDIPHVNFDSKENPCALFRVGSPNGSLVSSNGSSNGNKKTSREDGGWR